MQRVGGTMELLEKHRDKLSPEIIHYATVGLTLTARDIAHADLARAALYIGVVVDEISPNMAEAEQTFQVFRGPTGIAGLAIQYNWHCALDLRRTDGPGRRRKFGRKFESRYTRVMSSASHRFASRQKNC
jgi:hypothetical protein